MANNTVVYGSGTVISSLLFTLKNVRGDAEGFLLGQVQSLQVNTISDSVAEGSVEEKEICLHSFINLNKRYSFYGRTASPDVDKLHKLLGDKFQDVVGWFSYRPNSTHRISMREKVLHSRLSSCFSHLNKLDFVLALVTEHLSDMSSLCTSDYSFYCWDGRFVSVASKLATLPASIPYQMSPTYPHAHLKYKSTLEQHRSRFLLPAGTVQQSVAVHELCTSLLATLQPASDDLLQSSQELKRLHQEVELLRAEVATAHMVSGQTSSSGEPSTAAHESASGTCSGSRTDGGRSQGDTSAGADTGGQSTPAQSRSEEEMGRAAAAVGVLIDLVTSDDTTQSLAPEPHQLPQQQPDLLGDCVMLTEPSSSDTEHSTRNSDLIDSDLIDSHSQHNQSALLSQELF